MRYLIFAGYVWYPEGGFKDFNKSSESLFDSMIHAKRLVFTYYDVDKMTHIGPEYDWCHVVDKTENKIVFRCNACY